MYSCLSSLQNDYSENVPKSPPPLSPNCIILLQSIDSHGFQPASKMHVYMCMCIHGIVAKLGYQMFRSLPQADKEYEHLRIYFRNHNLQGDSKFAVILTLSFNLPCVGV